MFFFLLFFTHNCHSCFWSVLVHLFGSGNNIDDHDEKPSSQQKEKKKKRISSYWNDLLANRQSHRQRKKIQKEIKTLSLQAKYMWIGNITHHTHTRTLRIHPQPKHNFFLSIYDNAERAKTISALLTADGICRFILFVGFFFFCKRTRVVARRLLFLIDFFFVATIYIGHIYFISTVSILRSVTHRKYLQQGDGEKSVWFMM